MTYRLFWNVVRQQVETIVCCGCGLSYYLYLHVTPDWLMGSAVLSNILTQNTCVLEKFVGLSFTFTCDTQTFDVCRQVNLLLNL